MVAGRALTTELGEAQLSVCTHAEVGRWCAEPDVAQSSYYSSHQSESPDHHRNALPSPKMQIRTVRRACCHTAELPQW